MEVFQWQEHSEPVNGPEITAADVRGSDSTGFAQLDFGNILPFLSNLVRLDEEPFSGPNCIVWTEMLEPIETDVVPNEVF